MKNSNIIIISTILFLIGCVQLPPFMGKKDLPGSWHCEKLGITTPTGTHFSFLMPKYGFANLSIYHDSLYIFSLNISRDVVVEKEILGNSYSKIVINAGYKNFQTGFYKATDSSLVLYDYNKVKINEEHYSFYERTLLTIFMDEDKRRWEIYWEKDK